MKYARFEELPVWLSATDLAVRVFALGAKAPLRRQRALRDQIERAALSIANNIAEGFERGTTQELLTFLYVARGSAGEVRSMLCLMERIGGFADLKSEISDLTSKGRKLEDARRERDAFIRELKSHEGKLD
jgi:four helix bundle protein